MKMDKVKGWFEKHKWTLFIWVLPLVVRLPTTGFGKYLWYCVTMPAYAEYLSEMYPTIFSDLLARFLGAYLVAVLCLWVASRVWKKWRRAG